MAHQLVYSSGIYHGLPTFPDATGLTAIVTGANGISGYHMLKVLAQHPERWSRIYCLSRRPPAIPGGLPSNATHIACNFLEDPESIAEVLKKHNITAQYVFFFSYIQASQKEGQNVWANTEGMVALNVPLLKNFLNALTLASIKPRRVLLQTGAKYYGVQCGYPKQPMEEWDPRVNLEPNFYYPQEDALRAWSTTQGVDWNIAMPGGILGAVPDAAMNAALGFAMYAAVHAHLREPLIFPGDITTWQTPLSLSSAMLNAYLEEWVVLTDASRDQKFNCCDDSMFTLESFWPRLAEWYGLEWGAPGVTSDAKKDLKEIPFGHKIPPRGYGPQTVWRTMFTFSEWARHGEVKQAWKEIATEHGLANPNLDNGEQIFGLLDFFLMPIGTFSMNKAKKMGWRGFVDSIESMLEVFDSLAELKMIPKVPKVVVRFNR